MRYLVVFIGAFLLVYGQPALANEATKCFEKAWAHPDDKGLGLNRGQAVALCSGTTKANETTKCFEKAWAHPNDGGLGLTKGGAVDLCKSAPKTR